jgi:hypothetical protein
MISKIFLLILFFSTSAFADKYYFKADRYQPGLHLLAGAGMNASMYRYNFARQQQGVGINFKTDVGYYFNSQFAWEVGSVVKFNSAKEYLIWDTLFTTGFRYRFEKFPWTDSKSIYIRGFVGKAPTVFYLHDAPQLYRSSHTSRVQYNGPVEGFAIGNMYGGKDNKVWFMEYGFTHQLLDHSVGIKNKGEVPVEAFTDNKHKINIYSLYVNIGILVF